MTNVTFKTYGGIFIGYDIEGHAGFNTKGPDILCSAISSTTQVLRNYIIKKLKGQTWIEEMNNQTDGIMNLYIGNSNYANDIRIQAVFEATYDQLLGIAEEKEFKKFIKVKKEELTC